MSLLEDVLDLLQNVLEYFGVPPDMLVPVWENKLCGQYRSLVRMIGSNLPLTPSPRYHFQIPLHASHPYGHCDATLDTHPAIPSLADVLWVTEDEGNSFSTIRHCVRWSQRGESVGRGAVAVPTPPAPGGAGQAGNRARPRGVPMEHGSDPVALRKITALEDELLKLRAQIAMIVTAPMSDRPRNIVGTPVIAPVLTSTPRCPPPPPPGPPPTGSHVGPTDVGDLVRQRREARKGHVQGKGHAAGLGGLLQPQDESAGPLPSMLDVLKDLNQVKLRSVERSPGGTPVRTQRRKATVCPGDPAAMIAEALKRKFTHHRLNNSYDKENRSAELSPFGSPDVSPCVPQHFRRSQGRLHM